MDRMSSASSTPAAAAASSVGSATNSIMNTISANWPLVLASVVTSIFFIVSFYQTSKYVGSTDRWEEIKREIMTKVWPLTLVGTLGLFITSAIYLLQDPKKSMYFLLVLGCLSLGMSYSSLVIAIISK